MWTDSGRMFPTGRQTRSKEVGDGFIMKVGQRDRDCTTAVSIYCQGICLISQPYSIMLTWFSLGNDVLTIGTCWYFNLLNTSAASYNET